jgi:arginine utilization protein RocB
VITPDKYHQPLRLDFSSTLDSYRVSLTPHRSYAAWFCVLNENSADSAVDDFSAIMLEGINLAISYIKSKNSTFPRW